MVFTNCHTTLPKGVKQMIQKRQRRTPPELPEGILLLLWKGRDLYSELFGDKISMWESFFDECMKTSFNILLIEVNKENETESNLIASLTSLFNQDFVVLNIIAVKLCEEAVASIETTKLTTRKDIDSWQHKGIGVFLMRMMVSYMYVWNNGNIIPIVFQVR